MKMSLKILGLTIALWLCIAGSAYAGELNNDSEVNDIHEIILTEFELTFDDIEFTNDGFMTRMEMFEVAGGGFQTDESYVEDYNKIGGFELSNGFDNQVLTTFANEKTLVGQGDQGTKVGVLVYTVDALPIYEGVEEPEYTVTYSSFKTLGASGLYTETIQLEKETTQYVSILVSTDGVVRHRTYKVTTLEEEKREIFENIDIDFIDEEPNEEASVDSFMDWLGLEQEFEF